MDNLIRLFESNDTDFSTNGLGVLKDAESCLVTEERNGEFELEMIYPIDGQHYGDISMRRIIVTKSNPYSNPQPFRIYDISKPINGRVTINAEHISYDLSGYSVSPFESDNVATVFDDMKAACTTVCPFTFSTNKVPNGKNFKTSIPRSIRSLLGGSEGSVLDIYGPGEYEFDVYSVKFWLNRGENSGVTIRYGKNLTDVEQEEDCSSVYTGVYPYWYSEVDDLLVTLPEKIVDAETGYNFTRVLTLDLTDKFSEKPDEEALRNAAKNYIKDNEITVPKVSIDISFEQLSRTTDYKDYAELEEVRLCDTVTVEYPKLGVSATAKCIKTVYDALTDKYNKIELGSAKSNIANSLSEQSKKVSSAPSRSYVDKAIDTATKLITGNSGGYVIIHSSIGGKTPDEILIMDTDDINTAKNVWRWNMSGLGFSSTGYNEAAKYGVAITQDGQIVADFITTGTLNAIEIEACEFRSEVVEIDGKEDSYFKVTRDGTIYARKGVIGGCEISAEDGRLIIPGANVEGTLSSVIIESSTFRSKPVEVDGREVSLFTVTEEGKLTALNCNIGGGVIGGCEIQNGVLKVPVANIIGTLTADGIDASDLKVNAANIEGKLQANQINATYLEIDAGNITGKLEANQIKVEDIKITNANISGQIDAEHINVKDLEVTGKFVITGKSYTNAESEDFINEIETTNNFGFHLSDDGLLQAANAVIGGTIFANAGQIAGLQMLKESKEIGTDSQGNQQYVLCKTLKTVTSFLEDPTFEINVFDVDISKPFSTIKITELQGINATFENSVSVQKILNIGQQINVGTMSFEDNKIKAEGGTVMILNNSVSTDSITATISHNSFTRDITISLSAPLHYDKTFSFRLHHTWGGWSDTLTMPLSKDSTGGTRTYTGAFWGYDDAYFTNTGTKSYTFGQSTNKYVEFWQDILPCPHIGSGDMLNLGSSDRNWGSVYANTLRVEQGYLKDGAIITSDRNAKKDISSLSSKYDELINLLKPVSYRYLENNSNRLHIGFIAQDVKDAMDKLDISTQDFAAYCESKKDDGTISRSLRYGEFIALNTYAIQCLKERVNQLEKKITRD